MERGLASELLDEEFYFQGKRQQPPPALPEGFYSKLERVINEKMGGRATGPELRKLIANAGVMAEEHEQIICRFHE